MARAIAFLTEGLLAGCASKAEREFDVSGRLLRRFELPEKFVVGGWPPDKGVRHNLGFESLTVSPGGTRLFVGGEESLLQDGSEATFDHGALCRIVEYRVGDGEIAPIAEYAYSLGPVARPAKLNDVDLDVGLVELVELTESKLLALERDFIRERFGPRRGMNRVRIFLVDLAGATDVSGVASLRNGGAFQPVRKELLLDFDDIVPKLSSEFRRLDNFEAMGLGPVLPDGGRSLLVVSDDNFSDSQRSAFFLFSLKGGGKVTRYLLTLLMVSSSAWAQSPDPGMSGKICRGVRRWRVR